MIHPDMQSPKLPTNDQLDQLGFRINFASRKGKKET